MEIILLISFFRTKNRHTPMMPAYACSITRYSVHVFPGSGDFLQPHIDSNSCRDDQSAYK